MDLVIEARAFLRGGLSDVEIGIDLERGTISDVRRNLAGEPRKRYRGQILVPSGVDWHVHFRDPGAPQKEDFYTGTKAAALGGIGTVLDMPNTTPIVDRLSRLREKEDTVRSKAVVDWGLWGTVTASTPDPLTFLSAAAGQKLYLSPTTGIDAAPSDAHIQVALEYARRAGRWTTVHAESEPVPRPLRSNRDYDDSRPVAQEVAAIERLARLAADPSLVHVAHATSVDAVDAARKARIQASATPHHLLLSTEASIDAWTKVNPPVRPEPVRRALFDAFEKGRLGHLESDHAPHTLEEKRRPYAEAPSGLPGVQTMLPLMLLHAKRGDVALANVIGAACERPAEDLGLLKGRIEKGYRADFFLFDPKKPTRIKASELASKCGWSPFEGREALFPTTHILRGEVIVEEGRLISGRGSGEQIRVPSLPAKTPSRPAT